MPRLSEVSNARSVLVLGRPKSGKSTLGYTAPTPTISLNYDGGHPGLPPGVDGSAIFIQNYPIPEQQVNLDNDKWERVSNVAKQIISDIKEINEAFRQKREIKIKDVVTGEDMVLPLPSTLILDGCVELYDHIGYWVLAVNKKQDFTEFANKYEGYGKRLDVLKRLYNMILQLPCIKVFNTWEKVEDPDNPASDIVPDLGGKMDMVGPGKVDAVLRTHTQGGGDGTKYMIDTKSQGRVKCVGVRGVYNLPATVDITIVKGGKLPWAKLWNIQ